MHKKKHQERALKAKKIRALKRNNRENFINTILDLRIREMNRLINLSANKRFIYKESESDSYVTLNSN